MRSSQRGSELIRNSCNRNGLCAAGLNDVISRLDALKQGTLTVESYKYLGLSTVVLRQEADGVNLTYIGTSTGDAGDKYTGLDRFG